MSRSRLSHRTALVAVVAPVVTAGLVATAGPASAIPFEGDPSPSQCVRIVTLSGAGSPGSPLFLSHGRIAVLVPRSGC